MNDGMKKVLIVIVLLAAIGAVIAAKQFQSKPDSKPDGDVRVTGRAPTLDKPIEVWTIGKSVEDEAREAEEVNAAGLAAAIAITEKTLAEVKLPRLIEFGSVTCIPCKMMKPIIDELRTEYKGSMKVEFVDVWADEAAGKKYNIGPIPTQVFFDAEGKELFRHEGFFSKESIMAKWKEFGIEFSEAK